MRCKCGFRLSPLVTMTTSNTRLRVFLALLTYVHTHMQCHSSMHVCYDYSNPTLYHIINTFIHHHRYNSFHHELNPYILIQPIINSSCISNSIHHSHIVQFLINLSFISLLPIMNSHVAHLHITRLFTQVLMIKHQMSTYEYELHGE